jgi:hypothetical protein
MAGTVVTAVWPLRQQNPSGEGGLMFLCSNEGGAPRSFYLTEAQALHQPDFTTCGQGNTLATLSTKSPPLYPMNALIARLVERISSMEEI